MFVHTISGNSLSEFSGALEDLFYLSFCKGLYESADPGFRGGGGGMKAEVVPVNIMTCHYPETHKTSFL